MADDDKKEAEEARAAEAREGGTRSRDPLGILLDKDIAAELANALTICLSSAPASFDDEGREPTPSDAVVEIVLQPQTAIALVNVLTAHLESSFKGVTTLENIADVFLLIVTRQTALDLLNSLRDTIPSPVILVGSLEIPAVAIKRETALDLYMALVSGLGAVPAGKGGKAYAEGLGSEISGFELDEDLPGGGTFKSAWPDEYGGGGSFPEPQSASPEDSKSAEPEDKSHWKGAKPPTREEQPLMRGGVPPKPAAAPSAAALPTAKQRYVNLWFAEDATEATRIERNSALAIGEEVCLRMNIGPFDARHIMAVEAAKEFVSDKTIAKAFPETVGKPVPLEAAIFSSPTNFKVPEEARTQKFDLVSGKPTAPLYFPVTPQRHGRSQLRLCVFYKNHLLQSLAVTADVGDRATPARVAQNVEVEVTFSADFANAAALPARGLWLGINQSLDDTHSLNLKNSDKALSRDLESKIETALRRARQALREVSFDEVADAATGAKKKVYRFDGNNLPRVPAAEYEERFRADLTKLAVAGNGLYRAIFAFNPVAEEREKVSAMVQELRATLRQEQVIQIARLKHMEDIWPWALVYDLSVDPKKVKAVCTSYRGANGRALAYAEGVKLCRHADDDETIVCPYRFWGFKHIIEQPTNPGGKEAFSLQNLVLEIKPGADPVFEMLLEDSLGKLEAQHVTNMKGLNFKSLASFDEIAAAFNPAGKPPPPEPHLMYFFCHGKADDEQGPYLSVGAGESLLPSKLDDWDFNWANSRGLVFINGCHTVDLEPSELSSIMQPFVEANASGIIGTEISVTTSLAREFGYEFFMRFLGKQGGERRVGPIIRDLRLNLLMKYNPLGLVYTPYCSADLHVAP